MRLGNAMLERLASAGIEGARAAEALRSLLIYTLSFAAHEAPRANDPAGQARIRESQAAFQSAKHLGRLQALSEQLAQHADERTFETGLGWLLDGIALNERQGRSRSGL